MSMGAAERVRGGLDVTRVRADFPILAQKIHGRPLVYLDSAASTQKPAPVIDELARFYREDYANIHRGVYELSQRATDAHEAARRKVAGLLGTDDAREVVFTRNATEAINLVAHSFVAPRLGPGDEVLVTAMEHHANLVPWQVACRAAGAKLVIAPIDQAGELLLDAFAERIGPRTKMVAFPWVSNALGTINPVAEMTALAHAKGVPVLIDAAQAVQHMSVDVRAIECDFLACSGHKMYGPSGVGVLYGKAEHLEAMPPWQTGGDMIETVTYETASWNTSPHKFEAGTPDIAGIHALGRAVDYMRALGLDAIAAHEAEVLAHGTRALAQIPGLRLIGTAREKSSVLSFVIDGTHPQDLGTLLDLDGIAVRTGNHCAQPLIEHLGFSATVRASIGLYNTTEDLDALAEGLRHAVRMLV